MFWVKNLKLNFGGIAGAVICLVAALAITFLLWNEKPPKFAARSIVSATIVGAVVGNWIWSVVFSRDEESGSNGAFR
jgi:hypothetical protein